MKTPTLTKNDCMRLLRAVQALARHANSNGHANALHDIDTLTAMVSGHRYDILDDEGRALREATVAETVDWVLFVSGRAEAVPFRVDC